MIAAGTSWFEVADWIAMAGFTYDGLGRTRTVPAGHTDQPAGSSLTANYFGHDMVAKLTQTVPAGAGTTVKAKSFGLDPSLRLSTMSDSTGGVELRKTVNHYADSSDSPSWIATQTRPDAATGWSSTWSRNVVGPDGDLAMIQPQTGGAKIQLANLHGDVVATLDNGPYVGLGSFVETTEYGLARTSGVSLGQNYGWLGTERRSTDSVGGLTLMGVRLYNPVTGRFLSRDPMPGGNDNTYIYPADPINLLDLDGQLGFPKFLGKVGGHLKKNWKTYASVASLAVPGLGAAGMAYRGYRVARVIKAANTAKPQAFYRSTKTIQPTFRASRSVSKAAGEKWGKMGGNYRAPKYKNNQGKVTSNFTRYDKGHHLHSNFKVTHRGRR